MTNRMTATLVVIAALALPLGMAAAVLYASDAAIGDPAAGLTPQFGRAPSAPTAPPPTAGATSRGPQSDQGGSTADDHGGGGHGDSGGSRQGSGRGSGHSGGGSSSGSDDGGGDS